MTLYRVTRPLPPHSFHNPPPVGSLMRVSACVGLVGWSNVQQEGKAWVTVMSSEEIAIYFTEANSDEQ